MRKSLFAVFAFTVLCSLGLSSMDIKQEYTKEQLKSLYQKAIECRNSGDKAKAADLFLILSYEGNAFAMHNYAQIKFAGEEFDLAWHWFSIAAELGIPQSKNYLIKMGQVEGFSPKAHHDDKKIALYLVAGSTRKAHGLGPVFAKVNDIKSSDGTHKKSFDERATTMDILPCEESKLQHIRGDAESFSFSKYDIKSAYLERLPTFTDKSKLKSFSLDELSKQENNTIGNVINNIALSMQPGALLEIELHPYFMVLSGLDAEDRQKIYKVNPFQAFIDLLELGDFLQHLQKASAPLCETSLMTKEKKISDLINLYAKQGIGEDLKQVHLSYSLIKTDFERIKKRCLDEFENIIKLSANLGKNMAQIQNIFENSVMGALLVDLAVPDNTPYIINYLQKNGFANVALERTTSKRNERKYVWMVTADKS